ncbi:isochorismate synthase family protein [Rivularia sp. PCC 7116]|uniref:isochorismate synthase n=1 Tax=Rivularia sp. PCC 7116 TaxID=373994 RepID=UPI00029EFAC0|nr:isochorismate synthase [Rivularia sp. PCC 7116]AFY52671.1 isochorismate synthase family protein [Rivularia sp. PCC 7116]
MTVSPCSAEFFVYNKELYQFLVKKRAYCIKNNCTQIASIGLEIDSVDPLVVFQKLSASNKLNFYWENPSKEEAIAAIDAVTKFHIEGKERFIQAEKFIKYNLGKIINFCNVNHSFSQPLFFCSFSFFDTNLQENYPFFPATVFLPKWQVTRKEKCCILRANIKIDADLNIEKTLKILWQKITSINLLKYDAVDLDNSQPQFIKNSITKSSKFQRSVLSALEDIRKGTYSKIVLADALNIQSSTPLNLFKSLNNLRQLHPNCCVFSTSNGKGQNFIGASPETLIAIRNQKLNTDALAGSAARGKTPAEDAKKANLLLNSQKERHEHSLVIDFITQKLLSLGLLPQVSTPRLRQLSNIQHLWTPIIAKVPRNVHPLQIVSQLHPTPAVAGVAPEVACQEIRRYESFERGLYAAPLGWIDAEGNCEFVVGIRSALIDTSTKSSLLYAGAGIVPGSDPQKEFAEIQLKLQALLKALT